MAADGLIELFGYRFQLVAEVLAQIGQVLVFMFLAAGVDRRQLGPDRRQLLLREPQERLTVSLEFPS